MRRVSRTGRGAKAASLFIETIFSCQIQSNHAIESKGSLQEASGGNGKNMD
jgi:hypothetical protein